MLLLLALAGGWLGWRWWQYHRWSQLVATLGSQPGLIITSFGRERGRFVVRGLRDPLSPDPQALLQHAQLDPSQAEFHWSAYYALDDALVQKRASMVLLPPPGVSLSVKEGVLRVQGQPPAKWLDTFRSQGMFIPGIRALDLGRFTPEQIAFDEEKDKIQSMVVKFPLSSAALSSAERAGLRNLLPHIRDLLNSPVAVHGAIMLEVVGHSDNTGAETTNQSLSQRRADRVAWELIQLGIPAEHLHAKGVAAAAPVRPEDTEENRQYNRSTTFRVVVASPSQP